MCPASHDGFSVNRSHDGFSVNRSFDLSRPRSKAGLSFCRLPLQTSHPAGVDPSHCPAFGTGRAPRERHHSILTALWRHAEQRRRSLGSPDRSAWQRSPDCGIDQAADFKTAPSGTTPSTTNLHSAISSFRARATTMIFRTRRPVDPTLSRNQQT